MQLFLHMVIISTVESKKEKTNKQSKKAERKICGIGDRMLSRAAEGKIDKAMKTQPAEHTEKQAVYVKNEILSPKGNCFDELVIYIVTSVLIL